MVSFPPDSNSLRITMASKRCKKKTMKEKNTER